MNGESSTLEPTADHARHELYDTLSQLRDRLDYAHRIDVATAAAKARIQRERQRNPLGFAAGIGATALLAGAMVWGVARVALRAFD